MMRLMGNRAGLLAGLKGMTSVKLKVRALGLLLMCLVWTDMVRAVPVIVHGIVYARGVFQDDDGNAYWGEYNPATGKYIKDLVKASNNGTTNYSTSSVRIVSVSAIQSAIDQYSSVLSIHPDLELVSRKNYQNNILNADDSVMLDKPKLNPYTAFVAMLPQDQRLPNNPDQLVLGEFIVDPRESVSGLSAMVSIEEDTMGSIIQTSENRIGLKTGFATDDDGEVVEVSDKGFNFIDEHHPVKPMPGVRIEAVFNNVSTNSQGKYQLSWDFPGCVYFMPLDTALSAYIPYSRFNPKSFQMPRAYFLLKNYSISCLPETIFNPLLGPTLIGMGQIVPALTMVDFPVDINMISGTSYLMNNPLVVGKKIIPGPLSQIVAVETDEGGGTTYNTTPVSSDTGILGEYDFDFDGKKDKLVLGYFGTDPDTGNPVFFTGIENIPKEKQVIGIWLTSLPN